MAKTTAIASYLTNGTTSASVSEGTITIPAAAIGLDTSDADDIAEFLNALLRTACSKYQALSDENRPEHMDLSFSTRIATGSQSEARRTFDCEFDLEFGEESVKDESNA